jgi:hypothetical protein
MDSQKDYHYVSGQFDELKDRMTNLGRVQTLVQCSSVRVWKYIMQSCGIETYRTSYGKGTLLGSKGRDATDQTRLGPTWPRGIS